VEHFGPIHPLTNLEITGRKPERLFGYVSIALSRNHASLYVSAEEENGGDVYLKLEKVIAPRQRRWPLLYSDSFMLILVVLSLCIGTLGLWPNFKETGWLPAVLGLAVFVWVCWWVCWFIRFRRYAVIRLQRHSERASFLQRNKDAVTVAIITTIITTIIVALITYFVPKLADKFFKPGADTGHVVAPTTHN